MVSSSQSFTSNDNTQWVSANLEKGVYCVSSKTIANMGLACTSKNLENTAPNNVVVNKVNRCNRWGLSIFNHNGNPISNNRCRIWQEKLILNSGL